MAVWSEPARYVINSAPTIHNINNDFNWNTILRVAVTAFQASNSLAELASDALVAIRAYWPLNFLQGPPMPLVVGSDNDAWDLILQLVYYADLVFRTVEAAIQITPLQGTNLHAAFLQNMQRIMVCAFLAADHLRGTAAVVGFGNDPELLNFMAALAGTNALGAQCPPLSGLGTVELLCRIIARGYSNMQPLHQELLASRLSQLPNAVGAAGWWDCYNKAIPKTVFVCAGSDDGAVPLQPAFVITTSQDEWGAFSTMQNFATRYRQPLRRLDWNGVGALRDPIRIAARSLQLRQLYRGAVALLPVVNAATRLAARNGVKVGWAHRQNHNLEHAMAMTCPGFQPKARCLRCQAFFGYTLHPIAVGALVIGEENALLGAALLKCHLARACAECIAHYACQNARGGPAQLQPTH